MAVYGYEAIDKTGKASKGSIDADSLNAARSELKRQNGERLERVLPPVREYDKSGREHLGGDEDALRADGEQETAEGAGGG